MIKLRPLHLRLLRLLSAKLQSLIEANVDSMESMNPVVSTMVVAGDPPVLRACLGAMIKLVHLLLRLLRTFSAKLQSLIEWSVDSMESMNLVVSTMAVAGDPPVFRVCHGASRACRLHHPLSIRMLASS